MPGDTTLDVLVNVKSFISPVGLRHPVLRDIRLTVPPGKIVALLGRSGGGKSTLLRILLGLDAAFDGYIRRPSGRVGVVFQDPRLLPWLTVADNLRLVMPGRVSDARIYELLELAGVTGIAEYRPGELSLGMARRVALARALAINPNLLVLDEPFASLDRQLAAALAIRVADAARRTGTTVVVATHELDHALAIADRICVLVGRPATIGIDVAITDHSDMFAIKQLRNALVTRFQFLGTEETTSPA